MSIKLWLVAFRSKHLNRLLNAWYCSTFCSNLFKKSNWNKLQSIRNKRVYSLKDLPSICTFLHKYSAALLCVLIEHMSFMCIMSTSYCRPRQHYIHKDRKNKHCFWIYLVSVPLSMNWIEALDWMLENDWHSCTRSMYTMSSACDNFSVKFCLWWL